MGIHGETVAKWRNRYAAACWEIVSTETDTPWKLREKIETVGIKEIARSIRGNWMVESYHWQLDVTFRVDANRTLNKHVAYNLNIM